MITKEWIEDYFELHREEYLQDLAALIAIDSSKGQAEEGLPFGAGPAEALAKTLEIARGYGLYIENWENYLGVIQLDDRQERGLDIFVHLDVIPAGDGWQKTEPFKMKIEGGRVYGRGSADDKGPALAAIYALRALKESGCTLTHNVRIMTGCDEESGSADLDYYFSKTDPAEMTFSPDSVYPVVNIEKGLFYGVFEAEFPKAPKLPKLVSLESGNKGNVIPDQASAVIEGLDRKLLENAMREAEKETQAVFKITAVNGQSLTITAAGTAGHASRPEGTNNACTAMLHLMAKLPLAESEGLSRLYALQRLFPHGDTYGKAAGIQIEDAVSGAMTVCLDVLRYDETHLAALFDSRTPVSASREKLQPVRDGAEAAGFRFTEKLLPPHHVPEDAAFVQTLLEVYELYTGEPGKCVALGGSTYVHSVENGVAFGCALEEVDNHMHGPDEFAETEVLLMSGKIFTAAIVQLCG